MDKEPNSPIDITVIIAAYNVERYIERAVRSALDQAGPALEVILVDDGSTDGTLAIASGIADARLTCIQLPRNGGPGAARNVGIARAAGRWIAILDGDDAFEAGRLARCLDRAKVMKADIVVDNLLVCRESGGASFPMFPPARFSRFDKLTLADFIAGNQSFMGGYALGYLKPVFSAAFLRLHHLFYHPEIRIGEDYLLLAKALACGAVCAVEAEAGYHYTVRAGSISHRLLPGDITRIADGDKRFLAEHVLDPHAARAQKRREFHMREAYAFTLLVQALKAKKPREALKALGPAPLAVRHLWRPAWVRLRKILRFGREQQAQGTNRRRA